MRSVRAVEACGRAGDPPGRGLQAGAAAGGGAPGAQDCGGPGDSGALGAPQQGQGPRG